MSGPCWGPQDLTSNKWKDYKCGYYRWSYHKRSYNASAAKEVELQMVVFRVVVLLLIANFRSSRRLGSGGRWPYMSVLIRVSEQRVYAGLKRACIGLTPLHGEVC